MSEACQEQQIREERLTPHYQNALTEDSRFLEY